MGLKNGDKSRYYRERRKKLAKRARTRAFFGKEPEAKAPGEAPRPTGAGRPAAATSEG